MAAMIWIGAVVTVIGVAGLAYCVLAAMRLRKSGKPEEEMRGALQKLVAINLAAFAIAALGLMAVVIGLILR